MRAITVTADSRMQWTEVPDPIPGPDEVLVEIHATGVNRADLLQRRGKYPPPPGAPEWMGLEAAGVVSEVGRPWTASGDPESGRDWQPGDRVSALLAGGGYAEKVAVRRELLLPVPERLSMEEAASLPEAFATAYLNLVLEACLVSGETVLIQAGASGVGVAAIQLARTLGASVLTTVGSSGKAAAISDLGADLIVDRNESDLGEVLDGCQRAGRPVDVVLDCVGGKDLGLHLAKLGQGGRWVLIATLAGTRTELDLRPLLLRGLRLLGSTLRSRPLATKGRIVRGLTDQVWPEIASGRIRPFVHRVLPIEDAEDAHAILERRENVGKVVLRVRR